MDAHTVLITVQMDKPRMPTGTTGAGKPHVSYIHRHKESRQFAGMFKQVLHSGNPCGY